MEYSDLTWLAPGDPFPSVARTGGAHSIAPGLLAAGGLLDMPTLKSAYSRGIFPWFSEGQPVLWWSPDPRMVLKVDDFRIHRSLRKTLQRFQASTGCEIRFDTDFATVIRNCAQAPRVKQKGTWILPSMVAAYIDMHEAGLAHSVETWVDGSLVAGLYCVAIGQAVFGESMFTTVPENCIGCFGRVLQVPRDRPVRLPASDPAFGSNGGRAHCPHRVSQGNGSRTIKVSSSLDVRAALLEHPACAGAMTL